MKCGAATVHAAKNGIVMGDDTIDTRLRPNLGPGFRGMVRNQPTELWAFGCTTCGYVELHVLDPAGLAFMAGQWTPVAPTDPPPS